MIHFSNRQLLTALCLTLAPLASAQTTTTVAPGSGDTVTVTETQTTWIQALQDNGVDIPANANGVVISNGQGGVITAPLNAVISAADATQVINAGTIAGGFNGINFVNSTNGAIANLAGGVISSDSRAVDLGTGTVVNNAGSILGTSDQRNGTVYADAGVNNYTVNNAGTIDAGAGNQGAGVALEIDTLTSGSLTNSGTIQGRTNTPGVSSASGAAADGVRLANFNGAAERVFDGTITNEATGVISSESASGTTAGFRAANTIGFQGTLDNAGLIEGVQNGVYFGNAVNGLGADHTGGVVNNLEGGRIESDSRAFNLDGTGLTVNNAGGIVGTASQRNGTFYADGTADDFTVNNLATGVIDAGAGNEGSGFGAEIGSAVDGANTFSLTNEGTIQGRGNASAALNAAGDGVRIGNVGNVGTAEVTLNNSGVISSESDNGTTAGVRFVNGISFDGVINNSGTISGVQNGLYFGNAVEGEGADNSNGVVNNLSGGVISSDSRAVNIDGDGLTLINDGQILATGRQRNGTIYADATADNYSIINTGFVGSDGLAGAGSGISLQTGSFAGDVVTGSVINAGTVAGTGDQALDAAIRIFSGSTDTTFRGDIVNLASGVLTADTAPAVLVQEGVTLDGNLINNGTIDGAIDLSSGGVELGATSLVVLDLFAADEDTLATTPLLTDALFSGNETIETGGDVTAGGVLSLVFQELADLAIGDVFDVIDAESILGSFSAVQTNAGVQLDTRDLLVGGSVTVSAVPEPASLILLGLGGIAIAGRRRRTA